MRRQCAHRACQTPVSAALKVTGHYSQLWRPLPQGTSPAHRGIKPDGFRALVALMHNSISEKCSSATAEDQCSGAGAAALHVHCGVLYAADNDWAAVRTSKRERLSVETVWVEGLDSYTKAAPWAAALETNAERWTLSVALRAKSPPPLVSDGMSEDETQWRTVALTRRIVADSTEMPPPRATAGASRTPQSSSSSRESNSHEIAK